MKNIVVYIGKDSNIHKNKRNYQHNLLAYYNSQKINQVIQNNPERYEYSVICEYSNLTDEELNWLECMEIMKHKFLYDETPLFNFTVGGEGIIGYRKPYENFEYTVVKAGFVNGKQRYGIHDRDHNLIKHSINKEGLHEIAEKLNNGSLTEEEAKAFKYTVSKRGFVNGKQQYGIYGRDHYPIKTTINEGALDKIADALNNGFLTEEEIKTIHGVKKILDMLEN